ncbi:MAG: hypothetical protein IJC79_00425 [Clostridia bacterium]|nr:hypothetical protein [Clostridia bacterium]
MAKKIIGIVLIVIGVFTAFLGIKAMGQAPETAEKLKEAVYVADAKIYPENEGKIVIVPGKIEAELPLVDVKTGLKLPTIKATKQSWYAVGVKSVDTGYDWSWMADGSTQTLTAECSVGEFKLYEGMLNGLAVSEDYKDFEKSNLKEAGLMDYYAYVVTDGVYISDDKGGHTRYKDEYEGAVRYKYRIMPVDGELEYTFVGVQKNGALVRDDSLGMIASTEGILNHEEVLAKNESNSAAGHIFAFVTAALFIGGGVVCIVVKKKEEN